MSRAQSRFFSQQNPDDLRISDLSIVVTYTVVTVLRKNVATTGV